MDLKRKTENKLIINLLETHVCRGWNFCYCLRKFWSKYSKVQSDRAGKCVTEYNQRKNFEIRDNINENTRRNWLGKKAIRHATVG